jgi:predicted nucleic acid-binding protein
MRETRRMIVVLDSNILFSDFYLDRPRLQLIREQAEAGVFTLAVPEVVVLETVNLYRRELEKTVASLEEKLHKPQDRLAQLEVDFAPPSFDVDDLVATYEAFLRKLLGDLGALVPGLPGVAEAEVVERALAKRKPFKKNTDAGYRDTLIWHNVIALAEDDEVVLISGNDDDFAEPGEPENLASDLRDDLEKAGLARDRVQLLPDTVTFIKQHVPESAQVRQTVQDGASDPDSNTFSRLESLLAAALLSYAPSFVIPGVREVGVDEITLPYEGEEDGVTLEYAGDLREVEILDARVDSGIAVLELQASADLTLSFFVPKWELWQLEEDPNPKAHIVDHNWSDHYAWLEATRPVALTAVASFDVEQSELTSIEITRLGDA